MRIVANSYGCSTANVNACYSRQFEKAISAFKAQGGLFIASAGNSGTNNDKVRRRQCVVVLLLCTWQPDCSACKRQERVVMRLLQGGHSACIWSLRCTTGMQFALTIRSYQENR